MAKFIAHSPNGQAYQCDSLAEVKQVEGGFKFRKKRNGGCGCGGACGNPHCGPKKRNGKRPADQYQFAAWEEKAKGMTDAELLYVIKDAREAAKAMRGHDPIAEGWYEDEANTMAQELYRRRQGKRRNPSGKYSLNIYRPSGKSALKHPAVGTLAELRKDLKLSPIFYDYTAEVTKDGKVIERYTCGIAGWKLSKNNPRRRRNPTGATLSEDYNMAVFAGAVEHGRLPADDASAEYKKGYAEGARIAKENKLAVAAAMGAFRTTGSQKRAGQMLREMAGKSPTSPVNNPRKKRRNPVGADPRYVPVTMNPKPKGKYLAHEKEEEQIFASMLAKLPVGVTMQAGKHRVRKLSKGYVVVDGERLGMKDAAAKLHGR